MIGFIPKLYPDELLYSFIARYHSHSLNKCTKYTFEELFGRKAYFAVPDLPINLKELSNELNLFLKIDVHQLMKKHTMLNYYINFIPENKKSFVKDAMITGDRKGAVHMMTGIMASKVKEKKYLLFCSNCAEEDSSRYGEIYIRLNHQLPGVYVCIKHRVILDESSYSYRSKRKDLKFPKIESTFRKAIDQCNGSTFQTLLVIANESANLTINDYHFNFVELQKIYKALLIRKGFMSSRGIVFQKTLAAEFINFYGQELLSILQSNVDYDKESCWLKAITRKHRKVFHPVRHILLIYFLGETVGTLNKVNREDNPFGHGPYLCLNKAAQHYGEKVIPQVTITFCSKTKLPIGSFKCVCGFHYTRKGSENEIRDEYKLSRVKEFGEVWIAKVLDLIHNKKYSFRATAKALSADTCTVIKYSKNLTLKVSTVNKTDTVLFLKKNEWLSLAKENPNLSITQLRKLNGSLYLFLYRKDKEWLKDHSPRVKRKVINNRVDWYQRDRFIRDEIEKVILQIMNQAPPIRITISRIGTEIGQRDLLQKHLNKLPMSKMLLSNRIEDKQTFQIRRVQYILRNLKNGKSEIRDWKVIRLAGLKKPLDNDVIIAMNEFTAFDQSGY